MNEVAYTLDDVKNARVESGPGRDGSDIISATRRELGADYERALGEVREGQVISSLFDAQLKEERRAETKHIVEGREELEFGELDLRSEKNVHEKFRRMNLEMAVKRQMDHNDKIIANPYLLTEGHWLHEQGVREYQFGQLPPQFRFDNAKLEEQTTSANIEKCPCWSLPLVRRLWPRLFFQDLVATMSMDCCEGCMFIMDILFGSPGETYAVGTRVDNVEDPDYSDCPDECETKNTITMDWTQYDIVCECKALQFGWSIQAEQDAECYHGIIIGDELLRYASMLMSREINRLVIDDLRTQGTAGNVNWAGTVPGVAPWNTLPPREYYRTLVDTAILGIDANIFAAMFMKSNWLVMDEDTARILESVEYFSMDPIGDWRGHTSVSTTPNLFGTLKHRWNVYVDPFLVADTVIVGTKGASWQETVYVFLSYIPIFAAPLFYDPRTNCLYRSVMTRFARRPIKMEGVGTVSVT